MKYLKKYSLTIIACLIFLLGCKSCQSCSRARQIDYIKTENAAVVDSLNNVVSETRANLLLAQDSIKILNTELRATKDANSILKGSVDNLNKSNETLSQTNRTLANSIQEK